MENVAERAMKEKDAKAVVPMAKRSGDAGWHAGGRRRPQK